jgi:hypothetical protein
MSLAGHARELKAAPASDHWRMLEKKNGIFDLAQSALFD